MCQLVRAFQPSYHRMSLSRFQDDTLMSSSVCLQGYTNFVHTEVTGFTGCTQCAAGYYPQQGTQTLKDNLGNPISSNLICGTKAPAPAMPDFTSGQACSQNGQIDPACNLGGAARLGSANAGYCYENICYYDTGCALNHDGYTSAGGADGAPDGLSPCSELRLRAHSCRLSSPGVPR